MHHERIINDPSSARIIRTPALGKLFIFPPFFSLQFSSKTLIELWSCLNFIKAALRKLKRSIALGKGSHGNGSKNSSLNFWRNSSSASATSSTAQLNKKGQPMSFHSTWFFFSLFQQSAVKQKPSERRQNLLKNRCTVWK